MSILADATHQPIITGLCPHFAVRTAVELANARGSRVWLVLDDYSGHAIEILPEVK